MTFVCNGQAGEPGDPGQDGTDGTDGADGDPGESGMDGLDSDDTSPGVQARRADRCATAGVIRVRVPRRFANRARVRVTANGQRRRASSASAKSERTSGRCRAATGRCSIPAAASAPALVVLRLTDRRVTRLKN